MADTAALTSPHIIQMSDGWYHLTRFRRAPAPTHYAHVLHTSSRKATPVGVLTLAVQREPHRGADFKRIGEVAERQVDVHELVLDCDGARA
jgi:hypothetical protein